MESHIRSTVFEIFPTMVTTHDLSTDPSFNVMRDVVSRDKRDQERNASPLIIADDAYEIDTSSLSANDAVGVAIDHINEKFKNL